MPEGLERIGVHIPSLLAYMVNFLVLLGVLYILAYKPLLRALRERTERIAREGEAAGEARRAREKALAEGQRTLAAAQEQDRQLGAEARMAADQVLERARAAGREEARAALTSAHQAIEREREQALEEVLRESADLVLLAAEKAVGEALDSEAQARVVRAATQEIGRLRLQQQGRRLPSVARVAAAVPLQPEELEALQGAVNSLAGRPMRLVCRTEPRLLGGLTVAIGSAVVDASVLGRLERLHHHLRP